MSAEAAEPPPSFPSLPEARGWLEALPSGQPIESGRGMAAYMAQLNRPGLDPSERLRILEIARGIAARFLASLEEIYGAAPQPLGPHAREAVTVARMLAMEMASGYETAVREGAGSGTGASAIASTTLAAMQCLGEAMRASYKSYSRVAPGLWKRMHALYLQAEGLDIAGIATAGTSVAEAYREWLLLALTDPYRLLPGEIDRALALVRSLEAPVVLVRERPSSRASAHFIVPCGTDKPPAAASPMLDEALEPDTRLLDANPVVRRLRARLAQTDASGARADELLARKLLSLWDDPPKRAFRREPARGSVAICVGVKPIAHFVAHDATADGEAEVKALREGITMPLRALPEDEDGKAIPIHEWAVINLSAGGLKVRRSASTTHPIAVGEVVGIRAPGKVLWTIGIARWITALDDGTTEFGVQFFADAVCAVWVRSLAAPREAPRLAVLLSDGEDPPQESLLAHPGTGTEGDEYELRGEGMRMRVRAAGLVEAGERFELLQLTPA